MAKDGTEDAALVRRLGGVSSVAIVAGSMLGVGIFINPRIVASQFSSVWAFVAMWVLGGATALAGASAYAQLGSMLPRAGGDYVYLREAYGRSVAAAGGWILVLAVFPGSVATMAVALAEYQLPVIFSYAPASESALGLSNAATIGLALVAVLTALNVAGAHLSSRAQVLATALPAAVFAGLAAWALVGTSAATPVPGPAEAPGGGGLHGFVVAYMAVYFAYSGWNAVGYVGGEVSAPRRNLPLGLLGGTVLVTTLYLVLCVAFVKTLGVGGLAQSHEAGSDLAAALFGPAAAAPVAALIAFAIVGSTNATVLGGARITYAMAHDGALPGQLGAVWKRTGTPARALWMQAIVSAALVATGTFEQLLAMTSLAMLVLGILTVSAVYVLRARMPEGAERPPGFGHPFLPAFYLAFAGVVVGYVVWEGLSSEEMLRGDFGYSLLGLALFVALCVAYELPGAAARVRGARG